MDGDTEMFRNGLEPWHLLIVVTVMVLLSGSERLPESAPEAAARGANEPPGR
jgi:Sec-independent protein translocase protein TatA